MNPDTDLLSRLRLAVRYGREPEFLQTLTEAEIRVLQRELVDRLAVVELVSECGGPTRES